MEPCYLALDSWESTVRLWLVLKIAASFPESSSWVLVMASSILYLLYDCKVINAYCLSNLKGRFLKNRRVLTLEDLCTQNLILSHPNFFISRWVIRIADGENNGEQDYGFLSPTLLLLYISFILRINLISYISLKVLWLLPICIRPTLL